ncbi:Uu.00g084070.m01.CDS01 [Anthostomella pinea]|uniref:Uu.00g084070.m01.CDS01 n=1 Tax=Anthostomella pinea TaxID=933095 RepID=A0AAI8VLN2_9PEZI|nr:Uu.00g084070.m01.CDS01 [Anthostomella pinea]
MEWSSLRDDEDTDSFEGALKLMLQSFSGDRASFFKPAWERLNCLWIDLVLQLEEIFSVKIHHPMTKSLVLPSSLIYAWWDCDLQSDTFVDFSFLWNWLHQHRRHMLNIDASGQLNWLRDRKSAVETFRRQPWSYFYEDIWGQSFYYVVRLSDTPRPGKTLASDLRWLPASIVPPHYPTGMTLLHYAAAVGSSTACRALESEDAKAHDIDGRLPIFYAARNGHLEVTRLLATRL